MTTTTTLECGHPLPPPDGLSLGYGIDSHGRRHCFECVFVQDVARLRSAEYITVYRSMDDKYVTNWPGWVLGRLTYVKVSTRARKVFVRVTDMDGRHWFGQGPAESGTYVNLRLRTGNRQ